MSATATRMHEVSACCCAPVERIKLKHGAMKTRCVDCGDTGPRVHRVRVQDPAELEQWLVREAILYEQTIRMAETPDRKVQHHG